MCMCVRVRVCFVCQIAVVMISCETRMFLHIHIDWLVVPVVPVSTICVSSDVLYVYELQEITEENLTSCHGHSESDHAHRYTSWNTVRNHFNCPNVSVTVVVCDVEVPVGLVIS